MERNPFLTDSYREEDLAVNSRSIIGMRVIGKGRSSLESFTGIMSMLPPTLQTTLFQPHESNLLGFYSREREPVFCCWENLHKLVKDDEIVDIQVTCDGTWSRHGHQAIYGVVVTA